MDVCCRYESMCGLLSCRYESMCGFLSCRYESMCGLLSCRYESMCGLLSCRYASMCEMVDGIVSSALYFSHMLGMPEKDSEIPDDPSKYRPPAPSPPSSKL